MSQRKFKNNCEEELKKVEIQLKILKKYIIKDELTEVLNRRGIKEEFDILFKEAIYSKNHPKTRKIQIENFSIIFIDIDNFKKINDKYGHFVGDVVLKKIAEIFRKKARKIDLVGRLGGEEFIIGLMGASEDEAYKKSEEIRKYVNSYVRLPKYKDLRITLSLGVASIKKSKSKTVEQLISAADKAMYEAKYKKGKNNTVKFSEITRKK